MKKYLIAALVLCLSLVMLACNPEQPQKLATPTNVQVSDSGLVTWDAVENAQEYIVTIGSDTYTVTQTSYQVGSVVNSFTVTVTAKAEGYTNSDASAQVSFTGKGEPVVVTLALSGIDEIKSGGSAAFTATVAGSEDKSVTWKIVSGNEYAQISETGVVTANEVSTDAKIIIEAVSNADSSVSARKEITIISQPVLTQAMLEAVDGDTIAFDGFINISLYTFGLFEDFYKSYKTFISTAMDGTYWYAKYVNSTSSTEMSLYYKNNDSLACQVGVSFMNDEEYTPMLDDDQKPVTWEDSGMYNNFKGLTVSDFEFNRETWRYSYVGTDKSFIDRMVASANPYDFDPTNIELIIEDGVIMGVYSKSEPDYKIAQGYKAVLEMTTSLSTEDVEVPKIQKYEYDEAHSDLVTAIENMQALSSYTLDYTEMLATVMTSGYSTTGFVETITDDICYFEPFSVKKYDEAGNGIRDFTTSTPYGYKKISDSLYNTFFKNSDSDGYTASRAYNADFKNAKPSFAFAAEIFTSYYKDEEAGTTTYYVDEPMSAVATTFYYGVGNDIAMYGIFATKGYISSTQSFTPFVVVKDGYIIEAAFYFYLGQVYGVAQLEYSDFNAAEMPEDISVNFTVKQVPTQWSELEFYYTDDNDEEQVVNAEAYLKEMFEDDDIAAEIPFFGNAIGDTFGFGLVSYYMPSGMEYFTEALQLYYDVPLDLDYTIEKSITALEQYVESLGFVKNENGYYVKDNICINIVDNSLDLNIYIWKIEK